MIEASALQKYSLFGGLLPEEIDCIRPFMRTCYHDAGETILREGEPNDTIYFLLGGRVDVTQRGISLVELGEGDTFGEMEFLDVMPAAATITALEPTTTAMITNKALHEVSKVSMRAFAMIIMNLARDLSRRLRRMDDIAARHEALPVHQPIRGGDQR